MNDSLSSDDTIIVRVGQSVHVLGDGFDSADAVEAAIEERFEAGEYEYGVFNSMGALTIEEETPEPKTFTAEEEERLDRIEERAEADDRVESISIHTNVQRRHMCSFRTHRIRYEDGEVDFSLKLDNDYFESVPISTIDENVEASIEGIFNSVTDGEATYLGYESSYASRGRRNPFIRVYGRVHRDRPEDTQLRQLMASDSVTGVYWSEENLSAVRILVEEPTDENYDANDYIVVLPFTQDGFDAIENEDEVVRIADDIEEEYDFTVSWFGAVAYNRTHSHVCLGITYDP